MATAKEIAGTIIEQMGGYGRLQAMVGAHNFIYDKEGTLTFRFKMCKTANTVKIKLEPSDTYTVTFYKITNHGLNVKDVRSFYLVYSDNLKDLIENFTGLYLSL